MSDYRIIPTVRKHIVPNNALPCGRIPIRIDKPTPRRVIVPALQIVQPRFRVVDVSAVAQGVLCTEGSCHRAGGAQRVAPCVVGVARGDGSLRRFRQAVVRSILEYLRAILFSRTDNSHIFTIELKIYKSISLVRLSMQ